MALSRRGCRASRCARWPTRTVQPARPQAPRLDPERRMVDHQAPTSSARSATTMSASERPQFAGRPGPVDADYEAEAPGAAGLDVGEGVFEHRRVWRRNPHGPCRGEERSGAGFPARWYAVTPSTRTWLENACSGARRAHDRPRLRYGRRPCCRHPSSSTRSARPCRDEFLANPDQFQATNLRERRRATVTADKRDTRDASLLLHRPGPTEVPARDEPPQQTDLRPYSWRAGRHRIEPSLQEVLCACPNDRSH